MQRPRVLITGGASGIGAAIARRVVEDGYEAVVIDRVGDGIIADLSDETETREALARALEDGPILRLVNNVGAVFPDAADVQSPAAFHAAWNLNLMSATLCAQALVPGMREAGFGRIVSMSSRAALGKELRAAYAATKAALIGLNRVWSLEWGASGITANVVAPGPIRTPLFDAANPVGDPRTQAIIDGIPRKRMGEPEDVAQAVSFFLDDRSGFITGQTLYVCGGVTVGRASI